jgi:hypothetical protein
MLTHFESTQRSLRQLAILFLAIILVSGVWGNHLAQADLFGIKENRKGSNFCTQTVKAAYIACKNEIRDDYWIAVGKCNNISDPASRTVCFDAARQEYAEAKSLCGEQSEARSEICSVLGEAPYDPVISPEDFVDFGSVIEGGTFEPNPYLPLIPGTTKIYILKDAEGNKLERIKVEVLEETKEILGVNCIVIRDRVWEFDDEGEKVLIEDTFDWLAQDNFGNVWYFGEIAKNFEDGELIDVEGSWKAGRELDRAGILMLAEPMENDLYRQEFSLGDAEDMGRVVGLIDSLEVRGVTYDNVLQTEDFTPVEPGVFEYKFYAPGVGLVLETKPEDGERVELAKVIDPE